MLKKIDRVFEKVTGVLGVISALCVLGVIVLITVDVLYRKMGGSVPGSYEITERLLMCAVFAGLAYTENRQGHIYVTMLVGALPRGIRFLVFGFMRLVCMVMSFYVAYAAYIQTGVSMQTGTCTTVLLIPLYPFYAIECVCMIFFGVTLLWAGIKSFSAIRNDAAAEEIQSSWN